MLREPLRLELTALHPPRQDDLKGPLAELDLRNGPRLRNQTHRIVIRPDSANSAVT